MDIGNQRQGAVPCDTCGRPKLLSTSNRNRGQLRTCTYCRQQRWRDANGDKIVQANADHYKANRQYHIDKAKNWRIHHRDRHALLSWHAKLRSHFSTPEYYDAKFAEQKGRCAICEKPKGPRRLDQDHCHEKRKPRGLLCNRCNREVGQYEALRPKIAAIESYLGKYAQEEKACTTPPP